MKRRPRVVVVGRGAPEGGGIPTYLEMLVREQATLGYEVSLLNLARPGNRRAGQISRGNLLRAAVDAVRVIRHSRRGDIVHVHSALISTTILLRAALLVIAARLRGAQPVLHAHGGLIVEWLVTPRRRRLARIALRPAVKVIAVSTGVLRALSTAGLPSAQLRLLHNGVDVDRFARATFMHEGAPRVLFVGGLTPRKGVVDLIKASTQLTAEGVEHELWLAGGVPDEGLHAHGEVLAAATHLVHFLGQVPPEEMPMVYAECDIFCLPSWWEAMPFTVLEAMSAGLPVVASDVGDVHLAVIDDVTGILVPPRGEDTLTLALRSLLTHPALRTRMGGAGRVHVREHFGQKALLGELAKIFDMVGGER